MTTFTFKYILLVIFLYFKLNKMLNVGLLLKFDIVVLLKERVSTLCPPLLIFYYCHFHKCFLFLLFLAGHLCCCCKKVCLYNHIAGSAWSCQNRAESCSLSRAPLLISCNNNVLRRNNITVFVATLMYVNVY